LLLCLGEGNEPVCWTTHWRICFAWKEKVEMTSHIEITSSDYWFKVVEMLQQNWALIDSSKDRVRCIVYFIGDTSGVFDQIEFDDINEAQRQLSVNGFARYEEDQKAKEFIAPPRPPFYRSTHANGAIYSSGRYWKSK
jgi:hypothetical protein